MAKSEFVWMGNSGCLLPFLIIFNLFFGRWIIGSTLIWLATEVLLILLFMLKIRLLAHKISQNFTQSRGSVHRYEGDDVIDVQGQVVEEEKRLKEK